jgi:hypothetical protein
MDSAPGLLMVRVCAEVFDDIGERQCGRAILMLSAGKRTVVALLELELSPFVPVIRVFLLNTRHEVGIHLKFDARAVIEFVFVTDLHTMGIFYQRFVHGELI